MKKPQIKTTTKKQITTRKTVSTKLVVLLLLLTLLFLGVVLFINKDGSARIRRIYYGHVVRQAYHKEYRNLKPALEGLGLNENKSIKSACKIEKIATDGVNTSDVLFCGLQTDNYIEITKSNKQTILDVAKSLDDLTVKHGGRMYTNTGPTFIKYFTDIANGVDYYPDFGATFVRGNYLCEVHINVAFSKPKPPAYSIQFGCNAPRVTQDDVYLLPPDTKI